MSDSSIPLPPLLNLYLIIKLFKVNHSLQNSVQYQVGKTCVLLTSIPHRWMLCEYLQETAACWKGLSCFLFPVTLGNSLNSVVFLLEVYR